MGAVSSYLREGYLGLKALVAEVRESSKNFDAVLSRITCSPGFPVAKATSPFWLEDPPFPDLCDTQSPELPSRVHTVIIGSGITGTSIARTLLMRRGVEAGEGPQRPMAPRSVVMLDARAACSGATGRNGGHIKIAAYEHLGMLKRLGVGAARAARIVGFQRSHLQFLCEVAETLEAQNSKGPEVRDVETVDFFVEEAVWQEAKAMVREMQETVEGEGRDWAGEFRVWEAEEAMKVSLMI